MLVRSRGLSDRPDRDEMLFYIPAGHRREIIVMSGEERLIRAVMEVMTPHLSPPATTCHRLLHIQPQPDRHGSVLAGDVSSERQLSLISRPL